MIKEIRSIAADAAATGKGIAKSTTAPPGDFEMSLGVVARMFKIPTFTLRFYELLRLIARHRVGGRRVYSWGQCERVALIVKARSAGLRIRDLRQVLSAMDEQTPRSVTEAGRLQGISLIHMLEEQQQAIGAVLGELYRIDWELSARLGVKDVGGNDETVKT